MAETPVHAGGSESIGAVDLPIQREAGTTLPVIWGQSLKGALRQAVRDATGGPDEEALFGSRPPNSEPGEDEPESDDGERSLKRGSVAVGDAQLLLFPVASLRECFAWLTSPLLLGRLARKAALLGVTDTTRLDVRPTDARATGTQAWTGKQVFGPFSATVDVAPSAAPLGATLAMLGPDFAFTRAKLATDVVLVSDGSMTAAARMATEIDDVEVVTVPGVGHAPDLSEPAAVAAIDDLLERVLRK